MPTVEEIKPTETQPTPPAQPQEKKKPDVDQRLVTTELELAEIEKLMEQPDKAYVRALSRDKTLHRVLHVYPRFTSGTGEDLVDHPREPKMKAQFVQWIAVIERFRLIRQGRGEERKTERESLGVFNMPALDFLNAFESAD